MRNPEYPEATEKTEPSLETLCPPLEDLNISDQCKKFLYEGIDVKTESSRLEQGSMRCALVRCLGLGEAVQSNFLLKCLRGCLPKLDGYIYPDGEMPAIATAFPNSFRSFHSREFQKSIEQYHVQKLAVFDDLEIGTSDPSYLQNDEKVFPVVMGLLKPINVLPMEITSAQKNDLKTLCGIQARDTVITLNDGDDYEGNDKILSLDTLLENKQFCGVVFYARRFGFNDFNAKEIKTRLIADYQIPRENVLFLSDAQSGKGQFQYDQPRVILVDRFGILNYLYAISHIGVVNERHNILEPVIAGARVIFDWKYSNDLARGERNPVTSNTFYGPFLQSRGIGFPCRKRKDVRKVLESCTQEKERINWFDHVTEYQDARFSIDKYKETLRNILASFE